MKKTILMLMACIVAYLGLGRWWVEAAPPLPASFYGTVTVNGANAPTHVSVEALIDGVTYAVAPVQMSGGNSVYSISVPGDIPGSAGKQGGQEGDTIQFRVGGLLCAQTAIWSSGARQNLNLTATGTLPTLTPTPSRTPTLTPTLTLTPSITPTPSLTPAITAAPGVMQFSPSRDTYISAWDVNANYGMHNRLQVRMNDTYRALLHFNTAAIPTNSTVQSARLFLYLDAYEHQSDRVAPVSVFKVNGDWTEMGATWNLRMPGSPWSVAGCQGSADRSLTAAATTNVTAPSNWYSWDVTALAQDWVSSPAGNRGMILITTANRELRFYSKDATDARYHPYLRIDYSGGVGPGPTATHTPQPGTTPDPPPTRVPPTEQLSEFRASQDVQISVGEPDRNFNRQGLRVTGHGHKKSLLDFDVSTIPQGSQIISAQLKLTASTYNDGRSWAIDVGAHRVNRSWLATQVTWNVARTGQTWALAGCDGISSDREATPAGVTRVQEVSAGTAPNQRKTYTWDVTSIVQAWVNAPASRAGMVLLSSTTVFRDVGFFDSAYMGDAGLDMHPLLTVRWMPAVPTATPTFTPVPATATPTATATPSTGTITGTVYDDVNRNGRRDAGELGLRNIQVQLLQGDVVLRTQATDGDGRFTISDLVAGNYMLRAARDGYIATTQNPRPVTVSAGQSVTADLGLAPVTDVFLPLILY
jgi:hypothetical protein